MVYNKSCFMASFMKVGCSLFVNSCIYRSSTCFTLRGFFITAVCNSCFSQRAARSLLAVSILRMLMTWRKQHPPDWWVQLQWCVLLTAALTTELYTHVNALSFCARIKPARVWLQKINSRWIMYTEMYLFVFYFKTNPYLEHCYSN